MATETIVTGKKYRILTDAANKVWNRVSFWHKASDCEFNDGKTAEAKLGVIDGITDSTTATSSRIAASAKAVSTAVSSLNNSISALINKMGGCTLQQIGSDFYIVGADSVSKKLGKSKTIFSNLKLNLVGGKTSSSGRRAATFVFDIDATDYDTLYIGNYTVGSTADGDIRYNLTCSVDGQKTSVPSSGTTINIAGNSIIEIDISIQLDIEGSQSNMIIIIDEISLA